MLCGLEIHQRLGGKKLFNRAPTPKPDEPLADDSIRLKRVLYSVSSELGKTDEAAHFESSKKRDFEYMAPPNFCSLVDSDEEPPSKMNRTSLLSVLKFAKSLDAKIVDEIAIMRKTIVDGSATSGFQRTALVSLGGSMSYEFGAINIQTISIEEESSGILKKSKDASSFRIDRLGIPLIEVATDPVFDTPKKVVAGARALGQRLRLLENVMRGLGTIRQDVNISIDEGARVEIKGLQDIKMLETLVENEVKRQEGIVKLKKELQKRGFEPQKISYVDVSDIFAKTKCKIISKSLDLGGVVLGAKLPFYKDLLGIEFYEGRRFGSELSDYAKMAGGVKGLIHSDEQMDKYNISKSEFDSVYKSLDLGENDAFVLIADLEERAKPAIIGAIERSQILGVVKETRKADERGGSSFMRPMAGSHRMYPETDLRPIRVTKKLLKEAGVLETIEAREEKLVSLLGQSMAKRMLMSYNYGRFMRLVNLGAEPKTLANILEQTLVALKREGVGISLINDEYLLGVCKLISDGKITKAAINPLLKYGLGKKDALAIAEEKNLLKLSSEGLKTLWQKEGGDIKKFMSKYRLVADGKEIMQLAKKK